MAYSRMAYSRAIRVWESNWRQAYGKANAKTKDYKPTLVRREMKWMVTCISMKWITRQLGMVLFSFALVWTHAMAEVPHERQGQLLYLLKHDCGSCHGMTLKGGLGPPLLPDTLANKPPELLVNTILHGRSGTPMAPWDRFLSEQEARWLVERIQQGEIDAR